MGVIKKLNKWANAHTYYPLDIVRIALGVFLFYMGVDFMSNPELLAEGMKPFKSITESMMVVHYIAPAHFVGGFLITIGLLTRWAAVAQLPVLIGAVLANFLGEMDTKSLVLASITLLACLFFAFYGSGKHSVDYYLKMQQ